MDAESEEIAAVANAIRDYLRIHPSAADTLEGIAMWWLNEKSGDPWRDKVRRAVEQLVQSGEVTQQTLHDGTVIVGRNKQHGHIH